MYILHTLQCTIHTTATYLNKLEINYFVTCQFITMLYEPYDQGYPIFHHPCNVADSQALVVVLLTRVRAATTDYFFITIYIHQSRIF